MIHVPLRSAGQRRTASGFSRGTAVLTPDGPRPIENLRCGDRVITRRGACVLRGLNRKPRNRYALDFGRPQIVLLGSGQAHCESGEPYSSI